MLMSWWNQARLLRLRLSRGFAGYQIDEHLQTCIVLAAAKFNLGTFSRQE